MLRQKNDLSSDIYFRNPVSTNLVATYENLNVIEQEQQSLKNKNVNLKINDTNNSLEYSQDDALKQQQLLRRTQRQNSNDARPISALSSTASSASADSGCSFGGSSPVNFARVMNKDNSTLPCSDISNQTVVGMAKLNSALSSPILPKVSLMSVVYNESKVNADLNVGEKFSQQVLINNSRIAIANALINSNSSPCLLETCSTKPNEVSLNNIDVSCEKRRKEQKQIMWNAQTQRPMPMSFPSPFRHYNNSCSFPSTVHQPLLNQSPSLISNPPAQSSQVFSDITQYINPEIHSVSYSDPTLPDLPVNENATKVTKQETYKTVMCQAWLESTKCLFGENCKFAHGETELRPAKIISRNSAKYKTKLCEKYTTNGICPYGNRCLFIHPSPKPSNSQEMAQQSSPFVNPELHPISSSSITSPQQLQINVGNEKLQKLHPINSSSKIRPAQLTTSQSLLNFHQKIPLEFPQKTNETKQKLWSQVPLYHTPTPSKPIIKDSGNWFNEMTSQSLSKNSFETNLNKKVSAKTFFAQKENCSSINYTTIVKSANNAQQEEFPVTPFSHLLKNQQTFTEMPSTLRPLNSAQIIDSQSLLNMPTHMPASGFKNSLNSQMQHYGSAALGREESEIWSSDSTRFVMGASLSSLASSSPILDDNFAPSFVEDDFSANKNYKRQNCEPLNNSKLGLNLKTNDHAVFEHLYNTLNDLIICRNKELCESSNLTSNILPSFAQLKQTIPAFNSSTLTLSSNVSCGIKTNELLREIELQKLEEYLIASEQMLSLESNKLVFDQNEYTSGQNAQKNLHFSSFLDSRRHSFTGSPALQQINVNNEISDFVEFNNFM